MKVFFFEKWPKIEKNSFLGIKIDLQLRFNIEKCPNYQKKDAYNTRNFFENFLQL
jgi:hypothetical protein